MISKKTKGSYTRSPQGFVLVAVLLLVGLATALVVTATMMARVERKAATNTIKIDQARANALFALDVALNQLQTTAGPDQRVTARAEILDATNAPPLSTTNNVKQPLWTGVWKTTNTLAGANNELDVGASPTLRAWSTANATWLVSGNGSFSPTNYSTNLSGVTIGVNATAAVMAKFLTTNNSTVEVLAPLIPIVTANTTTNGAYAYWVSDEGVKAKVNKTDPTLKSFGSGVNATADLTKNLLHFVAPQAAAIHKGSTYFGTDDLRTNTFDLSKVTTLQSLANIINLSSLAGTNASKIAADFTTSTWGVLADVRKGGLKRDLTAAFEDTGNTVGRNYNLLNPDGTNRVYQSRTSNSDTIPDFVAGSLTGLDGLRWINLYYHYNLYKSAEPSVNMYDRVINGTSPDGIGNPAANNRPYTIAPRGIGWTDPNVPSGAADGNLISYGALSPVFLGLRWDVVFKSEETAPGSGLYNLFLRYYPQFILYNPYSVRIHSSANNFRYGRAFAPVGNLYLQISVPDPPAATPKIYHVALNLGGTQQRLFYGTSRDDTQTLEPGEIRIFGFNTQLPDSLKATPAVVSDPNGAACEFRLTTSPFGLVSQNFTATGNYKYAQIQGISTLTVDANGNPTPLNDAYSNIIPPIPAATVISLRITSRPVTVGADTVATAAINFGGAASGDVSIPKAAMWPTDGGSGGSVLPRISGNNTTDGRRLFVASTPGVASTGAATPGITRSDLTAPVNSLTGLTQVFSFFVRKKGINQTGGATFNNSTYAIPWFCGNSINFNLVWDQFGSRWWDEVNISDLYTWPTYNPSVNTGLTPLGNTTTTWGNRSVGEDPVPPGGSPRIVLSDVPVQPMVSLGQFMHLQPFYAMVNTLPSYNALGFGSMFIGGSLASPEVPLNQTIRTISTGNTLSMDHSFLGNQALFDSYFFSTVPPAGSAPAGTIWPEQWTAFNLANSGGNLTDASKPLLNSRMRPYFKNGFPPSMDDLRDMERAAANLILDGAFNINSTSIAAWKAFLSSLSGNDLDIWDASSRASNTLSSNILQNPFVRFYAANSNGNVNDLWSGIRSLSDAEISDLAEKIVSEVKTRGPFLSMADFLNRRLGATSALTRTGALQAAIDRTIINNAAKTAGVNVSLPTGGASVHPIIDNMQDATGAPWKTTIGAPGYLMQQDLVQALSPAMTARSDTFAIRTYGEVRNQSTGAVESKAWAEAVVQRLPDYVNPAADASHTYPPTNADNLKFGRRFEVVSFRWLSPNEI